MKNGRELNVGIAGFGMAGSMIHAPLIAATPGLNLVKIASSRPTEVLQQLTNVKVVATAEELACDPKLDVVVVCLPNYLHAPIAGLALKNSKHVVIEKPFAPTTTDADLLIALAKQNKRVLSVFHNRRWDGDFLTLKSLVDQNAFGPINLFESHFDRFRIEVDDRWKEQNHPGGGIFFDLGCHLIDQMVDLFGPPDWVVADIFCQRTKSTNPDYFHSVFGYNNMRAILHGSMLTPDPGPRFVVHGEKGSFRTFGFESGKNTGSHEKSEWATWNDERITLSKSRHENFYRDFHACIVSGEPNPVSPLSARLVIQIIEEAIRSSKEGRKIFFNDMK